MGGNEASKTNKCTAACPPPPTPRVGCKQPRRLSGRGRSRGPDNMADARTRVQTLTSTLSELPTRVPLSAPYPIFVALSEAQRGSCRLSSWGHVLPRPTSASRARRAPPPHAGGRRSREKCEESPSRSPPRRAAGVLMEFRTMNVVYLRFCNGILVVQ